MLKLNSSVSHSREIASAVRRSELKAKQTEKIIEIRASLVANGFKTLTSQARALGLLRSTAWNLLTGHHKASGLSASIIKCILSSSELPNATRKIVEEYVEEKLKGTYGHDRAPLRRFSNALAWMAFSANPKKPSTANRAMSDMEAWAIERRLKKFSSVHEGLRGAQ